MIKHRVLCVCSVLQWGNVTLQTKTHSNARAHTRRALVIGSRAQLEARLVRAHQEERSQRPISHPYHGTHILGSPSCTPPLVTPLPPLLLFRVCLPHISHLIISLRNDTLSTCSVNMPSAPNSFAKRATPSCLEVSFEI